MPSNPRARDTFGSTGGMRKKRVKLCGLEYKDNASGV
jgi:hypothetical protein